MAEIIPLTADVFSTRIGHGTRHSSQTFNQNWLGLVEKSMGPNFRDWETRLKNHENCITPLKVVEGKGYQVSPMSFNYVTPSVNVSITGDPHRLTLSFPTALPSQFEDPDPLVVDDLANALNTMAGRIHSDFESFMGIVFVVELRKTIKLLKAPFKELAQLIDKFVDKLLQFLKRNPLVLLGEIVKDVADWISNEWLKFHLAITPLLMDVENILRILRDLVGQSEYKRAFEEMELNYGDSVSNWVSAGALVDPWFGTNFPIYTRGSSTTKVSLQAAAFATATIRSDERKLQEKLGFTLRNLPTAIWELIPFSFVVDYFFNVGDFLNSLNFSAGDYNYTWYGIRSETEISRQMKVCYPNSTNQLQGSCGSINISSHILERRTPIESNVLAGITSDLPSRTQSAHILALLWKILT